MKKLAVMPLRFLRRLTWRHKGNSGKLRKELQDQLNSIGFEWKAPNALPLAKDSRTKIEALLDHKAAHGHLAVSRHDKKYPGLASWMTNQRARLKNGTIPDELKRRLDDIGFPWKPRSQDTSETKTPPRPWDEMFSELADFFKLQGHCNVPNDWHANPELARWVYQQRVVQRQSRLTSDQVQRMEGIGFAWNTYDGDWDTMFARLVEHLRPMHSGRPRDRVMDAALRSWVVTQRQFKKRGELDVERERKLNSIGFEWSPYSKQWEQMFAMLRDFQSERGHCRVPTKWPKNPRLANWVAVQRARKSTGKLSAERIAALDALGFSWRVGASGGRPFEAQTWDSMFEELKKYKETHGNCRVPQRSRQHPRLADWVSAQRVVHNKGLLGSPREQKLADLGFDWNPIATRWDEMFAQLVEFKKRHGHTNVPQRTREFPQLGSWVRNQRRDKRLNRPIIAERAKRLDGIGFVWWVAETVSWEEMFAALVEFKRVNGHCNVPQKTGKNRKLGKWVNKQRTQCKRGRLRNERKQQLDSIGFVWNLRPNLGSAR